jgi:RNA polymerase sigma-70 factor (ECF subfamily)
MSDAANVRMDEFIGLYTSHEARLRGLALSLVAGLDEAGELLQETSLTLWAQFAKFQPGSSFFAWAGAIMQYKAKEMLRKRAATRIRFRDVVLDQIAEEAQGLSEMMVEREKALHHCIAKLAERDRTLCRLRYEKGTSIRQVAESAGRTEAAVRQALVRIRGSLARCVERHLLAGGDT